MLVLTRKVGDVIAIGDNIKIVVMAIKGKQVRLGVQADRNTVVHREEIYQKIQQEIKAASVSDPTSTKAAGDLLKRSTSPTSSSPSSGPGSMPEPGSDARPSLRSSLSGGKYILRRSPSTSAADSPESSPGASEQRNKRSHRKGDDSDDSDDIDD